MDQLLQLGTSRNQRHRRKRAVSMPSHWLVSGQGWNNSNLMMTMSSIVLLGIIMAKVRKRKWKLKEWMRRESDAAFSNPSSIFFKLERFSIKQFAPTCTRCTVLDVARIIHLCGLPFFICTHVVSALLNSHCILLQFNSITKSTQFSLDTLLNSSQTRIILQLPHKNIYR